MCVSSNVWVHNLKVIVPVNFYQKLFCFYFMFFLNRKHSLFIKINLPPFLSVICELKLIDQTLIIREYNANHVTIIEQFTFVDGLSLYVFMVFIFH